MVITVIALLALIIVVGVMARKNQEDKKHMIEHQILQLTKFKGELMSHHTLEDTFKIHRQLGHGILQYVQLNMECSELLTQQLCLWMMCFLVIFVVYGLLLIGLPVLLSQLQDYEQVLNGIKAEIRELKKKINSL